MLGSWPEKVQHERGELLEEQELVGSWPEKGRPERGELLEEQDVPLVEWAFVMLLLEEQAVPLLALQCHG